MSTTILFYSTSHGFGHASRDIQVLRALRALAPSSRLHLRTAVADWFLAHALDGVHCERSRAVLDVGIRQADSLHQDLEGTLRACRDLLARRSDLVKAEERFMRDLRPDVVVSDVPALPLVAASSLGLPAVLLSNFTWDWIYDALVAAVPGFAEVRDAFSGDYARAHLYLRLPFHTSRPLPPVASIEDVPMVARRATLPRHETVHRLGLPDDRVLVLLSFGGLGPAPIRWQALESPRYEAFCFVLTPPLLGEHPPPDARHLFPVANEQLQARGVAYADLVQACDVVLTKPGYGIVSECLANGTRVLYTSRGEFAEYPLLVEALETWGVAGYIPHEDLGEGRWLDHLERLLSRPRVACRIPANGAEVAARRILGLAHERGLSGATDRRREGRTDPSS